MKSKKLKKLSLNKVNVTKLNHENKMKIQGGSGVDVCTEDQSRITKNICIRV